MTEGDDMGWRRFSEEEPKDGEWALCIFPGEFQPELCLGYIAGRGFRRRNSIEIEKPYWWLPVPRFNRHVEIEAMLADRERRTELCASGDPFGQPSWEGLRDKYGEGFRATQDDFLPPRETEIPHWHTGEGGVKFRYDESTEELYVRIPADVLSRLPPTKFELAQDRFGFVKLLSPTQENWSAYTALQDIVNTILFWHR